MLTARVPAVILGILALTTLLSPILASPTSSMGLRSYHESIVLYAPAVARTGGGVLIRINLTLVYPGAGKLYFSATPLVELDTQATARVAAYVASRITGTDYYRYNYIVDMTSNSSIVGGPSAGGLMTVGFTALFLNKTINPAATMTGMINPDGSIGPVGGLIDKLEAVAARGYHVFLIPLGQGIAMVEKRIVHRYPWGTYESIQYVPVNLHLLGDQLGVEVLEVGNIYQALQYMLGVNISRRIVVQPPTKNVYEKAFKYGSRIIQLAENISGEAWKRYEQLGFLEKIVAEKHVNAINREVERLRSAENYGYPYLLSISDDSLREIYYHYLAIRLLGGESINDIISLVGQDIARLSDKYSSINASGDSLLGLYALKYYTTAIYEMSEAARIGGNDTEEAITHASNALADMWTAITYRGLAVWSGEKAVIDEKKFFLYYDLAESLLGYAYSLSQDLGDSNIYIDKANRLYDYAGQALSDGEVNASLVLIIDVIIYADLGIETLFISNTSVLENISSYLLREAGSHGAQPNSTTILLYSAALEAYRAGDPITSIKNSLSYMYLMTLAINTSGTNQSVPITTPTNNIRGGGNPGIGGWGGGENRSPSIHGYEVALYVFAGFITGFITAWILGRRGRREEHEDLLWPV